MTLIERLKSLGKRREAEGIYTDQNICENAIEEIERLREALELANKPLPSVNWKDGKPYSYCPECGRIEKDNK